MKYGILMFPTRHPVDVAVVARQAEALGFDSLWVGEHPAMPVHSTGATMTNIPVRPASAGAAIILPAAVIFTW